jgi:hypothetical protein
VETTQQVTSGAPTHTWGHSPPECDTVDADALDEMLAELRRGWSRAMDERDEAQIGRLVAATRALRPALIALSADAVIGAGHRGAAEPRHPAADPAG